MSRDGLMGLGPTKTFAVGAGLALVLLVSAVLVATGVALINS